MSGEEKPWTYITPMLLVVAVQSHITLETVTLHNEVSEKVFQSLTEAVFGKKLVSTVTEEKQQPPDVNGCDTFKQSTLLPLHGRDQCTHT